jgi:hypothetical protein
VREGDGRISCLRARVSAAAQIKEPHSTGPGTPGRLDAAAKTLVGNGCTTATSCAETATWIGDIRSLRGEMGLALIMYERAAHAAPTEARWLRLAEVASAAGEQIDVRYDAAYVIAARPFFICEKFRMHIPSKTWRARPTVSYSGWARSRRDRSISSGSPISPGSARWTPRRRGRACGGGLCRFPERPLS